MTPENPSTDQKPDENLDPLTGEAGAHPVATGLGAAAIGAAGIAVAAAVAGPVGVAAAVIGTPIIGGYVGKAIGEIIDPTAEEAFWREEHPRQPYAASGAGYEEYRPAYRTGYEGVVSHGAARKTFEEAEPQLRAEYEKTGPALAWEHAREASRAAWLRAQKAREAAQAKDAAGEPRVETTEERVNATTRHLG